MSHREAKKIRQTLRDIAEAERARLISDLIRKKPWYMPAFWFRRKVDWVLPGLGKYL